MSRPNGLILKKSHSDIILSGPESRIYLKEPSWSPDQPECEECQQPFDFLTRRHHCRRCGRCVCGNCSNNFSHLLRMRYLDKVRQCRQCVKIRYLCYQN